MIICFEISDKLAELAHTLAKQKLNPDGIPEERIVNVVSGKTNERTVAKSIGLIVEEAIRDSDLVQTNYVGGWIDPPMKEVMVEGSIVKPLQPGVEFVLAAGENDDN